MSKVKRYVVDTNVFIDAFNVSAHFYKAIQRLLKKYEENYLELYVSLHTLRELEKKKGEAWELAKTFSQVKHYPIGSWDEQCGSWYQQCGTWDDARRNEEIQGELSNLAKSGNDIRDRGAFIDGLCSGCDGFITSDGQFVKSGPLSRINSRFKLKVINPSVLAEQLL